MTVAKPGIRRQDSTMGWRANERRDRENRPPLRFSAGAALAFAAALALLAAMLVASWP